MMEPHVVPRDLTDAVGAGSDSAEIGQRHRGGDVADVVEAIPSEGIEDLEVEPSAVEAHHKGTLAAEGAAQGVRGCLTAEPAATGSADQVTPCASVTTMSAMPFVASRRLLSQPLSMGSSPE